VLTPRQAAAAAPKHSACACRRGSAGSGGPLRAQESSSFPGGPRTGGRHGRAEHCKLDFSVSAEPYKEKAFEYRSQMQSHREVSRTVGLCLRRDREFSGKVGKCVPKGLL